MPKKGSHLDFRYIGKTQQISSRDLLFSTLLIIVGIFCKKVKETEMNVGPPASRVVRLRVGHHEHALQLRVHDVHLIRLFPLYKNR
jgi:hypothetical protein